MKQNFYEFENGESMDYAIVHFSAIMGWEVYSPSLTNPGYSYRPFDWNRQFFPSTNDRSIYDAWLKYKNEGVTIK